MIPAGGLAALLEGVSLLDAASLLVSLGVLVAGLKWIRPMAAPMREFMLLVGGRPGMPGFPAIPPLAERMASIEEASREAAFHSQPNHGTSAHDALLREIREIGHKVAAMVERVDSLQASAEDTHAAIWEALGKGEGE